MGSIYQKADRKGRKIYYLDYRVNGIRKRERVGYSRKEAKEALESRLTDIRRQRFDRIFTEPLFTLSEIRDQYLRYSETVKSLSSYERDKGVVDRLLMPLFGKTSLNRITPQQAEEYRSNRSAEGVAPATINKEVQVLRHIVKKAVEWGKVNTNHIANVKPLKTPPGLVKFLQLEEIPKLVDACPGWLRSIVLIGMNTGLRRGEILGLRKRNIDKKTALLWWRSQRTTNERRFQ